MYRAFGKLKGYAKELYTDLKEVKLPLLFAAGGVIADRYTTWLNMTLWANKACQAINSWYFGPGYGGNLGGINYIFAGLDDCKNWVLQNIVPGLAEGNPLGKYTMQNLGIIPAFALSGIGYMILIYSLGKVMSSRKLLKELIQINKPLNRLGIMKNFSYGIGLMEYVVALNNYGNNVVSSSVNGLFNLGYGLAEKLSLPADHFAFLSLMPPLISMVLTPLAISYLRNRLNRKPIFNKTSTIKDEIDLDPALDRKNKKSLIKFLSSEIKEFNRLNQNLYQRD